MRKNFLYLATRYLLTKYQQATIKLMIHICFCGILVATCCLALVVSVMNGFEQATYEKMQSIYPDLILHCNERDEICSELENLQKDPNFPRFHAATQKYGQALLCNPNIDQTPTTLSIRAIIPNDEIKVSNIASKIISPKNQPLDNLISDNKILVGSCLAQNLELEIDDEVFLLCSKELKSNFCMNFSYHPVIISGVFKTGIDELDSSMIFCHQNYFDQLFTDHPIDQVHLKLSDIKHEQLILKKFQETFDTNIYSWKDLYPTLLSALKLEKYAMIFILMLIVFVASMNIMSLISMYITQKKRDVAILLCFGMTQNAIKKIFIAMSFMIAFSASLIGLIIAWTIGILLQTYPCIKLPDNVYDSDYLPIQLELSVFSVIFIVTILISIIASLHATSQIKKIKITETLKSS
ncbi:hypothetical protein A3J41_02550 [candidate division TM6 bacterium RIFCSPHIGHO2_12_FULL_38_8]|nr:MAG: hypothetical protein A3J41_02550 [candidate division TM6 bacterium RIFCSPHIGHO2_12_FULL_38_8]